ncbi:MAG: arsenate reductase (glutaredoxin) [Proteobacteria bacterium]|nr:arsenate reductase (glutaredoxin) [Pseudomonadota bacterium]
MPLPREANELLLLHNPRCSKSRATLALLEESGVDFTVRRYLEEPLDAGELRELQSRLGKPLAEWVRSGEAAYAEAGLGPDAGDDALVAAVAREPVLMERPILVSATKARVGRPPEAVLELLPPRG